MRLEIRIFDDQDQVVAEYKGDPSQPGQWRANPGQRLVSNMPQQSDNQNTGTYDYYGFSYQPHLHVNRPNGYTSPVPSPNNGLPQNFPNLKVTYQPAPGIPNQNIMKPWNPLVPTALPAPSATTLTQEVKQ